MAIRLPGVKSILRKSPFHVPKGYLAVYVGENGSKKKRFVVPISVLNEPSFQDLLWKAEDEYGFQHPKGGLTIPCKEDIFITMTSQLNIF
ncbi:auxin-induced protein 15A-like [Rutidosis leptorrhynchoides]|uniref:auxin-induced protein 15A-like n=1 Tax=Rutidosis leptorrhynchoides TaxID=125765 RepID=UPI003A9A09D8